MGADCKIQKIKCEVKIGDCLDELKKIENASVDCVVTSPPYNLGGDFHTFSRGKRVSYGSYDVFKDKMDEKKYQAEQIKVLNELYRVTKENSYCFYVHKERIVKNNIISPLFWITKTEWLISQVVVLDQKATANVDKRRFFPTHEYIFVLCKSQRSKLKNEKCLTSVWTVKKEPRKKTGHPAVFDYNVPLNCILAATSEGDVVLDCYAGTCTTARAAIDSNRNFIGIEISREYVDKNIDDCFKKMYEGKAIIQIKGE